MLLKRIEREPKRTAALSLRSSTVEDLDAYAVYYREVYGRTIDRSAVADELLRLCFAKFDKGFVAWKQKRRDGNGNGNASRAAPWPEGAEQGGAALFDSDSEAGRE